MLIQLLITGRKNHLLNIFLLIPWNISFFSSSDSSYHLSYLLIQEDQPPPPTKVEDCHQSIC